MDGRPEKFYNKKAYKVYLRWLQKRDGINSGALKKYFSQFETEINHALLFLRQINSEAWHDKPITDGNEYDYIHAIDTHVHPAYLRLTEAILIPLIRPIAYFYRTDQQKGTDGLNVWSVVQELKSKPEEFLILSYQHIIRNGIAHGGITFLQKKICYRDNKGDQETYEARCVVRLFDDLLDTCNGIAMALKMFFLISHDRGYISPRQFLVEELQEETRAPWWTIDGCVDSEITGKPQLIIHAQLNSRRYAVVQWSTIQSGILAEFFAPGYSRYFFSLRSRNAWPGWAAFNGEKLRSLREAGSNDLSQYRGIIEDNLVFYVPRSSVPTGLGKLDTLVKSFCLHMPIAMQQIRENLGIPRIICRNTTVHRNSWGAVIKADVVIEELDDKIAVDVIHRHRRRILRAVKRHARKNNSLSGAAYLPLGYAEVKVFRRDYRCRRLSGFGLGEDLVCTVRFQRIRRIKSPNIIGSTVQVTGKWCIAWNKAWLEANDQHVSL